MWSFEPLDTEQSHFRIQNAAYPDHVLSNDATLVERTQDVEEAWTLEQIRIDAAVEGDTYLLHPVRKPGTALGTTLSPPYRAQLVPGKDDPSQTWLLTLHTYCEP
jgi:hypothetical protein